MPDPHDGWSSFNNDFFPWGVVDVQARKDPQPGTPDRVLVRIRTTLSPPSKPFRNPVDAASYEACVAKYRGVQILPFASAAEARAFLRGLSAAFFIHGECLHLPTLSA
ncbi:MAG: hypothetical protein HY369_01505 [Candidatus Aenigmarchaeota archaeon]|nr:hypothetical protein [Candidatus Aenigmarchaeota archaeon]